MERNCVKYGYGIVLGMILMMLALDIRADWPARKGPGRTTNRSPDQTLVATVIYLKRRSYGDAESRVEIYNLQRQRVAQADYHSHYGNQGYTVEQAGWTADSRFFVYITQSSGWHHPWHHPLFFYSKKRKKFYSVDNSLERLNRRYGSGDGAITGELAFVGACTVKTRGRVSRSGFAVTTHSNDPFENDIYIDIGKLESVLTAADEARFFYSPAITK